MNTDARQEKGRLLSLDRRIKHVSGATWSVPSQTANSGAYMVNVMAATCSCPDYELRRRKCKHLWAVEIVKTVETAPDGSQVVTESVKVTRKTYTQDWPSYNAAQWRGEGDDPEVSFSARGGAQGREAGAGAGVRTGLAAGGGNGVEKETKF